jgi:hypothetical protein
MAFDPVVVPSNYALAMHLPKVRRSDSQLLAASVVLPSLELLVQPPRSMQVQVQQQQLLSSRVHTPRRVKDQQMSKQKRQ